MRQNKQKDAICKKIDSAISSTFGKSGATVRDLRDALAAAVSRDELDLVTLTICGTLRNNVVGAEVHRADGEIPGVVGPILDFVMGHNIALAHAVLELDEEEGDAEVLNSLIGDGNCSCARYKDEYGDAFYHFSVRLGEERPAGSVNTNFDAVFDDSVRQAKRLASWSEKEHQ